MVYYTQNKQNMYLTSLYRSTLLSLRAEPRNILLGRFFVC